MSDSPRTPHVRNRRRLREMRAAINRYGLWYLSLPLIKLGLLNVVLTLLSGTFAAAVTFAVYTVYATIDEFPPVAVRIFVAWSWVPFSFMICVLDVAWFYPCILCGFRKITAKLYSEPPDDGAHVSDETTPTNRS